MNRIRQLLVLLVLSACARTAPQTAVDDRADAPAPHSTQENAVTTPPAPDYARPREAELRKRLSPLQFEVTQRGATEPAFRNAYWNHHEEGLYVDSATGEPLFSSRDKFDSGTGWPSFTRPIESARVTEKVDSAWGMTRTEVLSAGGRSHLGHVFDDGPAPIGLRYCINSASLRFIPLDRLEAEGYGAYRQAFTGTAAAVEDKASAVCATPAPGQAAGCQATTEEALLAGGCFWGMEEILRKVPGVLETEVGYTGGSTPHPTYDDVHTGRTGHAEAVRIVFDPGKVSYADLLEKWFFKLHDPTTPNRQGNDIGSQYRSAIFATSEAQKKTAAEVIARVNASGKWKRPVVTEVVTAGPFTAAEGEHQDYLQRNPGGYTCHWLRD